MDGTKESEQELDIMSAQNLNLINDSLSAFEWLTKRKYKIVLAHKGKITNIDLVFLPKNYVHIAGVNKLEDISVAPNQSHAALYRDIKKNEELRKRIAQSSYFDIIVGRLYSIIDLKDNLEDVNNNRHFKFIKKVANNYTQIEYDFFIESKYDNNKYYYFLRYSHNPANANECVLVSTFIENEKDYSIKQEQMTLLKKTLVDLNTSEERIIYDRTDST